MVPAVGAFAAFTGYIRELWSGPVSAASAPAAPVIPSVTPPTKQEGASGIPNYGGQIWYEPIEELRGQAGYGRTGGEWGFWEDLSAANSFVAAALDHICAPVGDCRVDIEAIPEELIGTGPGKVSKAIADSMLELLKWNFTEKLKLQAHCGIAGRGFLKSGFALFEPTAELAPDGRWFCAKLSERLPLSLHPNAWIENDEHTTLKAVRQQTTRGMVSVSPEIPAERLLLYIWQRQGTNWQGRSAFRAVQYIAGYVMPTLLKLIGVTLQREGAGIPVAEADDPQTPLEDDQRVKLVELMKSLVFHESANAVMPAGWKLKWVFSGGSNKGHVLEVWRELGIVVLQQLSAQQLALGTSNTGARSVGEVHDARSAAKVKEVLTLEMAVLNGDDGEPFQGLGPRVCQWNFGVQAAYPRIKLTMQRPEMPAKELAEAASLAKEAGLITPTLKDQNTMRERLGMAPITQEEFDELSGAGTTTALNGAQVTAATDLMQRVADGQLPIEAATEALVTFYNVPPERAAKLMATLKTFDPTPKEIPGPLGGQPKDEPDEDEPDEPVAASSKEPERDVWNSMWARCSNPNSKDYARYGGRGIKVCKRWESYESFIKDMGKRPSDAHSIDRIDNDGNYEPKNCRWATAKTQRGNRSDKVKASAQRTPWQPWRALRASEAKLPLRERAEYFDSRRDVYEARVRPVIQSILAKAAPGIARAMADGKVQPAEIAALELKAAKLFELNRLFVDEVRSAGAASVRDELADRPVMAAAADGDDREDDRAESLRDIRDNAQEIADAQADALTRRQLGRLKGELEREGIDALRTKGTAEEVIDRAIDRQLETGALRADAGYVTTKAFNVGRDEAARILGGIASVEYSAVLDSATCSACARDDGRTAAFNSAEHDALLPPNRDCSGGDNCRCFLIMVPGDSGGGDE